MRFGSRIGFAEDGHWSSLPWLLVNVAFRADQADLGHMIKFMPFYYLNKYVRDFFLGKKWASKMGVSAFEPSRQGDSIGVVHFYSNLWF